MKHKNSKKKWVRTRHRFITNVAGAFFLPYVRLRYGISIKRFKEQKNRPYLILYNHQTAYDQFFVAAAFRNAVYYVASEDIFSLGWLSSLIRYLVAPIPIKKQTTDIQAVMNCMRVAKEGGTIAIAPEGNRTYSGKTEYINPAIARLAKALKLPIAFFRIEGGYGVHPRWSDVIRRGKMRAFVSRVVEPEAILDMTDEELMTLIRKELYVNEASVKGVFRHRKSAEYLERAIYVCPYCGLSTFYSHNDTITCTKCDRRIHYLPTKELKGAGFSFPFRFVAEWYDYQCDFVNKLDTREFLTEPIYQDTAAISMVFLQQNKLILHEEAWLSLYGNRIVITGSDGTEMNFPFNEVSAVTVLGKNKLNIYHGTKVYQIKGDERFNALKYVNIFYRNKSISKENEHGKFLGL